MTLHSYQQPRFSVGQIITSQKEQICASLLKIIKSCIYQSLKFHAVKSLSGS